MAARNGRNVSLTDEHNGFVDGLLHSGRYASASEVVRDGLRLLQREEERRLLNAWLLEGLPDSERSKLDPQVLTRARRRMLRKVREGLDALDRGDVINADEFFASWRAKISKSGQRKRNPRPKTRR